MFPSAEDPVYTQEGPKEWASPRQRRGRTPDNKRRDATGAKWADASWPSSNTRGRLRLLIEGGHERGLQHVETLLELWSQDIQRHEQANHISIGARSQHKQAALVAEPRDFFRQGLCRLPRAGVAHEFDGLHGAEAAHVADFRPAGLPVDGPRTEPFSQLVGTSREFLLVRAFEHGPGMAVRS